MKTLVQRLYELADWYETYAPTNSGVIEHSRDAAREIERLQKELRHEWNRSRSLILAITAVENHPLMQSTMMANATGSLWGLWKRVFKAMAVWEEQGSYDGQR